MAPIAIMENIRTVLGVLSMLSLVLGVLMLAQEKQTPDCHKRYWCGDPQQADLAWMLIVVAMGLQAIKCWVT